MKIIRDTREQNGFFVDDFTRGNIVVIDKKLNAGDYSIEGLEDKVSIERKATTGELYINLSKKTNKERFYRELEILSKMKAYIVCEFPESLIHSFPEGSGIPESKKKFLRVSGKYFRKMLYEIEEKFNIKIIYCRDRAEAEHITFSLLESEWKNMNLA